MRTTITSLIALTSGSALCAAQWDQGTWSIVRLGLVDAEHTYPSGACVSYVESVNSRGHFCGKSQRPVGSGSYSEWFWSPEEGAIRIGLVDSDHTAANGTQISDAKAFNNNDVVMGESVRYAAQSTSPQRSVWVWTRAEGTQRIGLQGPAYVSPDGAEDSRCVGLSDAGAVLGYSSWYSPSTLGFSSWVRSPDGTYSIIGLHGVPYTGSLGLSINQPIAMNPAGHAIGVAGRTQHYGGGNEAWAWRPGLGTVQIGLGGLEHRLHQNGRMEVTPTHINGAGHVIGYSTRAPTSAENGRSAWWWSPETGTVRIGLFGSDYTRPDTFQYSDATLMSETGLVAGTSRRYVAYALRGYDAWAWTPQHGITQVGPTDSLHTAPDGTRDSRVNKVSGEWILGFSSQYFEYPYGGPKSFWTWNRDVGLTMLGLTGPEYTRSDGATGHLSSNLTSTGLVVGESRRFSGMSSVGSTTWFYDPATGEYSILDSVGPGDDYRDLRPDDLLPNGWVTGWFTERVNGVERESAFLWSREGGFVEIEDLPEGGLLGAGWTIPYISLPMECVPPNIVYGDGKLTSEPTGRATYLMTRVVPVCDSIDFNGDGLFPDILDISDFLTVFAGGVCHGQQPGEPPCNTDVDFNNDTAVPDAADIGALLRVFSGGDC